MAALMTDHATPRVRSARYSGVMTAASSPLPDKSLFFKLISLFTRVTPSRFATRRCARTIDDSRAGDSFRYANESPSLLPRSPARRPHHNPGPAQAETVSYAIHA